MVIEIFSRAKDILDGQMSERRDDLGLTDDQFEAILRESDRDIDV